MVTDINLESHVGEDGTVISNRIIAPEDWTTISDVLKFSDCKNIVVDNCTVEGGNEDCIDAVRGSNYKFSNTTLLPHKNGITLKGSIDTFTVENVKYLNHGTDCDMEFGQFDNYWYVGRPATCHGNIINTNAEDGKPLVLKLWDATTPGIVDSNIKVIKIPKFIWFPYFVFRAIQTRGIQNIFTPVQSGLFIKTK